MLHIKILSLILLYSSFERSQKKLRSRKIQIWKAFQKRIRKNFQNFFFALLYARFRFPCKHLPLA